MHTSRIPDFTKKNCDGLSIWVAEMSVRDLLFHPDDAPGDINTIATNEPMLTTDECEKFDKIIAEMFNRFGDKVYEAAYPVFMKQMGLRLDV